jgi:glucokinase
MSNAHYIAVEIGGTKLQATLGHADGRLAGETLRGTVDPGAGAPGILAWIAEQVEALISAAGRDNVRGIGVGFGGPIDSRTGTILVSHQIDGWQGFALKPWFEERFALPALVANDSNAAGWAEYCLGAGRGTRNFVYNNIGSGIGGALIINGALYDGQGLGAGEIGHTLVPDWTTSTPGAVAKLEDRCSGWAIERRIRQWKSLPTWSALARLCGGDPFKLTCAMLGEAARAGDSMAISEIDRVARGLATALANVITLFSPERIALGGGVALMGEELLGPVRKYTELLAFGPYRGHYEIVPCALEEAVVLSGALLLAGAKH